LRAVDHHPFADLFFLLALLIVAAALIYGLLRRRRWLIGMALLVLIGPPLVLVVKTSGQYWKGTARLRWQSGRPRHRELYNLDSEYRAFAAYPYHPWRIWERLGDEIEQDTLVLLIETLGSMQGSYLGFYPTRDEVRAALLQSQDIVVPRDLSAAFTLGSRTIHIPSGALSRALIDATEEDRAANGPRLKLVLVAPSCLVLGYWGYFGYHAELIDLAGFGWFAHYVYYEDDRRCRRGSEIPWARTAFLSKRVSRGRCTSIDQRSLAPRRKVLRARP